MLQEIEINKLMPNDYNPPNRATRNIESLSSSLKGDGQISTITVRPLDGKFEIVDGTRRYEGAKKANLKKMLCNILDLTREEAEIYNYIANKETEVETPMDEGWRFFRMLGLSEEQLFQDAEHGVDKTGPITELLGLPGRYNKEVQALAERLGVKSNRIAQRLPLMALPSKLAVLLEKGEMAVGSAEEMARLRLLEDKKVAHDEMLKAWKKCGNSSSDLNVSVTATIEDYRLAKQMAEKDLKPYEDQAKDKLQKFKNALDKIEALFEEYQDTLPDELKDDYEGRFSDFMDVDVPDEIDADWTWPSELFRHADRVSAELTRDDKLAKRISVLQGRSNDLQVNRAYIKDHGECRYCGTAFQLEKFDKKLEKVHGEMGGIKKKDDARASAANINNKLRNTIRDAWSDYSSAKKALDVARKKKDKALERGGKDGKIT